jgi:hypothetical protein
MGVGSQRHAPANLPPEKTRYPFYRWLVGPQGRSGRVRNISPPPRFDPRSVQPVASRYTDWAIPARCAYMYIHMYICKYMRVTFCTIYYYAKKLIGHSKRIYSRKKKRTGGLQCKERQLQCKERQLQCKERQLQCKERQLQCKERQLRREPTAS